MKIKTRQDLIDTAFDLASVVEKKIKKLKLRGVEYRRDYDGVSRDDYLLMKMIGEILKDGRPLTYGLISCTDENEE